MANRPSPVVREAVRAAKALPDAKISIKDKSKKLKVKIKPAGCSE